MREDMQTVDITLQLFQMEEDGRYSRMEEQITECAYPPEQIKTALKRCGFDVLGIYSADTEEELHEDSQRMVVVARKEETIWES